MTTETALQGSDAPEPPPSAQSSAFSSIVPAAPKERGSGRKKLPFVTAAEFASATPAMVPWLVEPWVVTGCITELDGKVKQAGKTTFVAAMVNAVLEGKKFLGYPTKKTKVVWLTEQPGSSFREVLRRADLLNQEDLHVLFWKETLAVSWPAIVQGTADRARDVGAELVIVDTIGQFAKLRGDAENSAGEVLKAMEPLQAISNEGFAVLVARHERKGGGEVGESGRGSSAFAGVVDIVMAMGRPEGNHRPNIRQIRALSRFDETPPMLMIELTKDGYVALGNDRAVESQEAREKLLGALPTSEAEALRLEELLSRADIKRTVTQQALEEFVGDGPVRTVGKGVKGDPKRYYRVVAAPDSSCRNTDPIGAAERTLASQEAMDSAATPPHPAEGNGVEP